MLKTMLKKVSNLQKKETNAGMIFFSSLLMTCFICSAASANRINNNQTKTTVLSIINEMSDICDSPAVLEEARDFIRNKVSPITMSSSGYSDTSCTTYHISPYSRLSSCLSFGDKGRETQEYSFKTERQSVFGRSHVITRNHDNCRLNN